DFHVTGVQTCALPILEPQPAARVDAEDVRPAVAVHVARRVEVEALPAVADVLAGAEPAAAVARVQPEPVRGVDGQEVGGAVVVDVARGHDAVPVPAVADLRAGAEAELPVARVEEEAAPRGRR